jgi:hypothetical protein
MFTTSRKNWGKELAGLLTLALLATNVQAQTGGPPTFPGFPNPTGTQGTGGSVYTPFNPLAGSVNPGTGPYSYYPNNFGPSYYYQDPVGSYLYGSSAVLGSAGQYQMNQQMAQIYHQLALQKQLETAKMVFELNKYIKENTKSFGQEEIEKAEKVLLRILKNATPGEIWNGKALNVLLKDLKTQQDLDKFSIKTTMIPEAVLRQMNVTIGDSDSAGLGILRDKGAFTWPLALLNEKLVPKEQRDAMSTQASILITKALNGTFDEKVYNDLKQNVDSVREKLVAKVLEIDGTPYIQAKRFLDSIDDALVTLQLKGPNLAVAYADYQHKIKGGMTIQDLVLYMKAKGMWFGPANAGDEASYEAVYSALANYDLLFNTQLVANSKKN